MKITTIANISLISFLGVAMAGLLTTTDHARKYEERLRHINSNIDQEQRKIHSLEANLQWLMRPQNIENLTSQLLPHFSKTHPLQIVELAHLQNESNFAARLDKIEAVALTSPAVNKTSLNQTHPALGRERAHLPHDQQFISLHKASTAQKFRGE